MAGRKPCFPSFALPGISLLEKSQFPTLLPLCRRSKNLYNLALYSIRQYFFAQRKFLRFELSYHAIKDNQNYQALNINIAQQTMKVADRSCSVAFSIWSRRHKQVNTDSKILVCRNTLIKMATSAWLCLGFGWKTVNGKSRCRLSSKRNMSKSRLRFRLILTPIRLRLSVSIRNMMDDFWGRIRPPSNRRSGQCRYQDRHGNRSWAW